jgi:hypothetical protein
MKGTNAKPIHNVPTWKRPVEADLRSQVDTYTGSESREAMNTLVETALDRWADWFTSSFHATLNSKSLTCLIQGNEKPEGLARILATIMLRMSVSK